MAKIIQVSQKEIDELNDSFKQLGVNDKYPDLINCKTMSAKIRYLDSCKLTRGQISKVLNIRYQWVRNVLITPIKKI